MKNVSIYIVLAAGACAGGGYRYFLELGGPGGPFSMAVISYVSFVAALFLAFAPFRLAVLGLAAQWIAVLLIISIHEAPQPFGGRMAFVDKLLFALFFAVTGLVESIPAGLFGLAIRYLFTCESKKPEKDT